MTNHIDLGLPEKIELQEYPDYLHISRKWFGWQTVFMTVFAVFWNGFLYNFFNNMGGDTDLFARLFPLIHVAAGVGITYHAIAVNLHPNGTTHLRLMEPPKKALFYPQTS